MLCAWPPLWIVISARTSFEARASALRIKTIATLVGITGYRCRDAVAACFLGPTKYAPPNLRLGFYAICRVICLSAEIFCNQTLQILCHTRKIAKFRNYDAQRFQLPWTWAEPPDKAHNSSNPSLMFTWDHSLPFYFLVISSASVHSRPSRPGPKLVFVRCWSVTGDKGRF